LASSAQSKTILMLDAAMIRKFAGGLNGHLVLPGDDVYESARRVWNWAVDVRPGLIVRCANRDDVIRAVDFARSHDLVVAVRAGGHSYAGHSTCDGGMVIDLSLMKAIRVDNHKLIAHVQAGVTNGEFDARAQSFGLAAPLGACSATEASPDSPWAAVWDGSLPNTALHVTTCLPSRSSWPMGVSTTPTPIRSLICSGEFAAAPEISE
jgi:hypothetical protein